MGFGISPLKAFAAQMSVLKYKAVAKETHDPRMQQVLATMGSAAPDIEQLKSVARDERPFLPELAWAYFTAYRTVLYGVYGRFMILRTGLENPEQYLSKEGIQKILKTALPYRSEFIDEKEPEQYYVLLDEIEIYLLMELRKILEGKDVDQASATRAREIMDAVNGVEKEQAEKAVAHAKRGG